MVTIKKKVVCGLNFYPGGVYDFAGMLKSRNGYQNPNVQCSIPKYQFSRQ